MVDFLIGILQALNLQWAVDQMQGGNAEPLLWWTLAALAIGFVVGFASSHAHSMYRAKHPVKFLFMNGMSKGLASAMLQALDADGMVSMGAYDNEIMGVKELGLKVFDFSDSSEYVGNGSLYQLSNEWRRYLRKPWRRRKLERIAGK